MLDKHRNPTDGHVSPLLQRRIRSGRRPRAEYNRSNVRERAQTVDAKRIQDALLIVGYDASGNYADHVIDDGCKPGWSLPDTSTVVGGGEDAGDGSAWR